MPAYNPVHAWRRAAIYFAVCILIAVVTGTLQTVLTTTLVSAENLQNPN